VKKILRAAARKKLATLVVVAAAAAIAHAAGVIDAATMLRLIAAGAGVPDVAAPALNGAGTAAGAVDLGAIVNGVLGAVASP